ncbi:carbohydrate ABC transporter permease [Streptomyces sp. ASQP_92]|uniref:carbohydrate ABC transporter permease n=1 Tax=Streptomyces sp. ASQP_92 TaxID=2979116 RepID=UPI0021BE159C|nr:carbohydrate ABC transporter permease [Streptomyces sp. ASQP_92]MCT9091481.1 carbohydrate ABC transporter permease [Streptomyces sp. ASQP_92]
MAAATHAAAPAPAPATPASGGRPRRTRSPRWRTALRYAALLAVLLIMIGPFLWQLSTSFKGTTEDIYTSPPRLLPAHPTFANYGHVADTIPVWDFVLNSVKVAVSNVATNVVGAAMAGYALARLRFRGRGAAGIVFVLALLVPMEATMLAQFATMRSLELNNTLVAVVLPGCIGAMNVLLMRNAFGTIPYEIEEAAIVDGANVWQRFTRIALPAVKGTLAVVAIFSFMGAWDDFLWPLIVLSDSDHFTLTVGLNFLHGTFSNDQRVVAAGTIIAVAPLIVMFACLQRFFFRGVGEGAVKG